MNDKLNYSKSDFDIWNDPDDMFDINFNEDEDQIIENSNKAIKGNVSFAIIFDEYDPCDKDYVEEMIYDFVDQYNLNEMCNMNINIDYSEQDTSFGLKYEYDDHWIIELNNIVCVEDIGINTTADFKKLIKNYFNDALKPKCIQILSCDLNINSQNN